MAPPKSQDQLQIICRGYSKSAEKTGNKLPAERAAAVNDAFQSWRDRSITPWLDAGREPTRKEIRHALHHAAPLIACQRLQTLKRMDASAAQEQAVAELLLDDDWELGSDRIIKRDRGVPLRRFLRKARFTAGERKKEIDIAMGLGEAYLLALECKVSNDSTNSTKRVNDIAEKAAAWRGEYGRGLITAAMLQGVYRAEDVIDLASGGVQVFWFHDLPRLTRYLALNLKS
jgi:hypothetical protein